MKLFSLGSHVTAVISIAVFCLSASRTDPVRDVGADPVYQDNETQRTEGNTLTCTGDKIELDGATRKTFRFKCSGSAKLVPVEQLTPAKVTSDNLENVHQFTPPAAEAKSDPPCTPGQLSLTQIVPGSSLKKVAAQEAKQVFQKQDAVAETVFELIIGEAQEQDKHFCYVCTPDTAGNGAENQNGGVPGDRTAKSPCTVYVTVPGKVKPPSEDPNESASFSPAASGWLSLSVGGCALGLMLPG